MRGLQDVDFVNHRRVHLGDAEFDFAAADDEGEKLFALRFGELLGIVQAGEFGGQTGFRPTRRQDGSSGDERPGKRAATGPASGPRPASSTPAMRATFCCHSARSNSKRSASLAVMASISRDEVDDRDSNGSTLHRWCLQKEIAASAIRRGRRKIPRWLCLDDG